MRERDNRSGRTHEQEAPRRGWAVAAVLWLLLVLGIAAHQWQFWQEDRLDLDVLALLPQDERQPAIGQATRKLTDAMGRQVVVLIGGATWEQARQAAELWRAVLAKTEAPLVELAPPDAAQLTQALEFYRPWRQRLLTGEQRQWLGTATPQELTQGALASLYQPAVRVALTDWAADPLGLWPQWWRERAGDSRARQRDGRPWLSVDGVEWEVLRYESRHPPFKLDGRALFGDALQAAQQAVRATLPQAKILQAGVPLHAEAAAVQASREVNLIGWGSLLAVLLLVWLAFASLRPLLLVALSLLVGCAAALSVTAWVFGQVHLLTLVFGVTLVGVAEDYGIHYFAARQGQPWARPRALTRQLLPSMLLALLTSVVAYLALGVAEFPGLRQMAVFSATGLVAAMLTVVCWFPWLDRTAARRPRFAAWIGGTLAHWPRAGRGRAWLLLYLALAGVSAFGLLRLQSNDDVRQLQSSPPALAAQQKEVASLLGMPSPAQFFLVTGRDAQEVLQREEALKPRLDQLTRAGVIAGYSALSDWLPSHARQQADAALARQAEQQVLAGVNAALGESFTSAASRTDDLSLAPWLAHPVSAGLRALWLGEVAGQQASVILLRGLHAPAQLAQLAQAGNGLDGLRWVDRAAEMSALLARYRHVMAGLLLLGHVTVLAVLAWRYGRQAWRAWLPTALASLITLACFGLLGLPVQLFNVLALALLLGVGVDYGVFLLEHRDDESAWLAVVLGALSTWLSFGLLALSGTPALRAFGLTLLIGLALVGVLAPLLRATKEDQRA